MADRMRLLELCMKESAAAFGWGFSGTHMTFSKGNLSFLLLVYVGDDGLDFTLYYRYSAFDRVYNMLTSANIYPGLMLTEGVEPVELWSLMGVSAAMRRLAKRSERFAYSLSEKLVTPEDNLDFLRYLAKKQYAPGQKPPNITTELILTALLKGDNYKASSIASGELLKGNTGDGLYAKVIDYARRYKR